MLKRKTYFKAIFVLPLLLQISLLSINFQSNFDLNNPNYSIMNHDITTICQMGKFDIDKNEKNTLKLIESKEISVIPELENIFCLGKVVEVFENDKEIVIYIGTNRQVFNYVTFFNLGLFLFSLFLFNDKESRFLKIIIFLLFVSTVLNLNWLEPKNFLNRISLILLILVPIIGLLEILKLKTINLFEYKLLIITCFVIVITLYLEQISNTLRMNRDTYVWLNTAIRMDQLNLFEYKSTWEHKGSVIFWVYYIAWKFINVYENVWLNLGLVFILFNSLCSYIVYKILSRQFIDRLFVSLISFLVFVNLTFSPKKTTYSMTEISYGNAFFDTRIIGSSFILLAIYFLIDKKYYYSTFYLIVGVLSLPSFLISSLILFLFIILYELKENQQRIKLLSVSFIFVLIYILYLLFTSQLYDFYLINIKFNLLLNNVGEYYPIEIIIRQNIVLFLNFAFILIFFSRLKRSYGRFYLITLLWSLTSLIHLILTGPRWAHYETIIVIPFVFCGGLLFNEIYKYVNTFKLENKKNYLHYFVFTIFLGLYTVQYSNNMNYISLINSENNSSNLIDEFNAYGTHNRESSQLAIILVKDSEWDYLFNNYSFVPATRTWPTLWHKRDEGWYALYPFDKLFDEQYFKNSFFDDLENENPKYAVLGTDIKNTYNNYLYDYVLTNYTIEKCERSYCIYKLNNLNNF